MISSFLAFSVVQQVCIVGDRTCFKGLWGQNILGIPILSRPSPPPWAALLHWVSGNKIYAYTKNGKLPISPLSLFFHCSLCECWMHLGRHDTSFSWCWTWTWPWPWQGQRGAYVGLSYLCGPYLGHLIQQVLSVHISISLRSSGESLHPCIVRIHLVLDIHPYSAFIILNFTFVHSVGSIWSFLSTHSP